MPTKILVVAGARPNFMKIAPLMRAFGKNPRVTARLVHTGQHYDAKMSKIFFEDLNIPSPTSSSRSARARTRSRPPRS